jgi:hypothetical protein
MQARVLVTTDAGVAATNGAPAMDFWCGPRQCTTAWLVRDSTSEEDGEPYTFWVSVA